MIPLPTLRAEAETLARQLPAASLSAAAANVVHPGGAGRRRAGPGEDFWQFRHYSQTDAADQIDWRRSARGDEYFVRETELETARTILFWTDPAAGFDWTGSADRKTKADTARTLMLALGILLANAGERIGALGAGRSPSLGKSAPARLAESLISPTSSGLAPPRGRAIPIIASDFYDGVTDWQERLAPIAGPSDAGIIFYVCDPVELDFPFSGRIRFNLPGTSKTRILGRAELAREAYLEKLDAHISGLTALAGQMGWAFIRHRTDEPPLSGAARLLAALEQFGVKL